MYREMIWTTGATRCSFRLESLECISRWIAGIRKPEGPNLSTVGSFVTDGDNDLRIADSIAILLGAWRSIGDEEVLSAWAPLT
jgi:hypothetical protein